MQMGLTQEYLAEQMMAVLNAWLSGLFTLGGGAHFIMGM
jgi:hypothetical protein